MRPKGIDVSHWNDRNTIARERPDFVLIKASEGKTWRDNLAAHHERQAMDYGIPYGFYHFCRADNYNSPMEEAQNFLDSINFKDKPLLLALDVEGASLHVKSIDKWCLDWLNRIEIDTGIKPLIYVQHADLKKFKKVAANGNGLWVARYNSLITTPGNVRPFPFWAIWQHSTRGGVDRNVFNGNIQQLYKYMRR